MKRLMIMRHGDAESSLNDKSRMLTRKGRSDMQRLHTQLLADGLLPEFALASDAPRTRDTLQYVTGQDFSGEVAFAAALYNAAAGQIIGEAQMIDDRYESALIVAHNPGVYEAVLHLTRQSDLPGLMKKLGNNYKSGTLTVFECPIKSWSELKAGANAPARLFIPD
jgi:phosphohistidine phosphatase